VQNAYWNKRTSQDKVMHGIKADDVVGNLQIWTEKQIWIVKGKAVPLQSWSGPEGSRKLRSLDYMTRAQDGAKVVSLTHRPSLPPGNAPGTHFC
jgi:hypothetical protein